MYFADMVGTDQSLEEQMRSAILVLFVLLSTPVRAQPTSALPGRDRPLTGEPSVLFSLGQEEGESWELLSNVSGVDFDGAGNLFVLDAGNQRVLVFDRRGRFVRSIARRGGGPGELMAPTGLAVLADGTVVVADLGRSALSVFAPDGTFRFNVPYADSLGAPGPEQRGATPSLLAYPSGVAVFGGLRMMVAGPGVGGPPQPPTDVPVYVRPLDAKAPPRLLYRIPREAPVMRGSGDGNNRSVRITQRAFSPQPSWAVLPDGGLIVVSGTTAEYRLSLVSTDGQVRGTLTRPIEPRRPSRDDQDRAREQLAERMRSGTGMIRMTVRAGPEGVDRSVSTGGGGSGPGEAEIQAQVRELQFADRIPVIAGLRSDPQGRIWVGRAPRQVGDDGPIDLLDAQGRYLGTLSPQPLPDAVSATGVAAYITRDDLGVERVVVKELPANWK